MAVRVVLKDELETAMQMVGITKLSDAHPGLLNTAELDPYVYRGDAHPWARKIVRRPMSETGGMGVGGGVVVKAKL